MEELPKTHTFYLMVTIRTWLALSTDIEVANQPLTPPKYRESIKIFNIIKKNIHLMLTGFIPSNDINKQIQLFSSHTESFGLL